jgi:hypothetical protein
MLTRTSPSVSEPPADRSGECLEERLSSLLTFLRERMPSDPLCARIQGALASEDPAAMRAAMQAWFDRPLPDPEAMLQSEILSRHR